MKKLFIFICVATLAFSANAQRCKPGGGKGKMAMAPKVGAAAPAHKKPAAPAHKKREVVPAQKSTASVQKKV